MKKCVKCKNEKQLSDFSKLSCNKDGYHSLCKICINQRNKKYRDNNLEKMKKARKKYYDNNIDRLRKQKRESAKKFVDKKADYDVAYRLNNVEKIRQYKKNWAQKHKNDPVRKIKNNLRRRIHHVIKNNYKSDHTMNLLGCSIEQFILYLKGKFQDGMTLENYGIWHIDHIIPCCNFDLSQPDEQKKCFHYTNLQPLWAKDNLKKGRS